VRWSLALALAAAAWGADIDPEAYQAHVRYLASDELKGRASGSPQLEQAAAYIERQFAANGVKSIPGSSYQQEFTVDDGARLQGDNRAHFVQAGRQQTLKLSGSQAFTPFASSSTGVGTPAPVVFAGYGITAADLNYDDYADIDVKDKYVLILRHEPQESDKSSIFNGTQPTTHSTFVNKAINARNHGARGVILVNDSEHHPGERDSMLAFNQTGSGGPTDAGLFYVQVSVATAQAWLKSAGRDLRRISAQIDNQLKPQSFVVDDLMFDMKIEIAHEQKRVHNVVAYVPGQTDEYVIIGAHYDHLGLGGENSLAPNQIGRIHHGADDNASGTAGVLELARHFAKLPPQPRGILFITFAAEEIGLLGSAYYAGHALLPLDKAVAMLNLDMIGRIRDGKIYVNGTGSGTTLDALVKSVPVPTSLKVDLSETPGFGGSDHMSFAAHDIPFVFFFSGLHADYHKPSDTSDKINRAAAATLTGYVADVAAALLHTTERPRFQRTTASSAGESHSSSEPLSSGYGPNFGSIPDFDEPPKGVRFADVRAGTPADQAGLRRGDILIRFDGKEINNLYDFTYALQSHRPGDQVLVVVLRQDQSIEAKVLLTERR
jgi:hypothetical protein